MKVVDVQLSDLDRFYKVVVSQLNVEVEKTAKVAVIGIAESGVQIADGICKELVRNGYFNAIPYVVRCKRPHSKIRDTVAIQYGSSLFGRIPRFAFNFLRIVEHHILSLLRPATRIVHFDKCENEIRRCSVALIVDDAVDSGHTMKSVLLKTKEIVPEATIKLVAYNTTQKNPVVEPNYVHRRGVLVRFPWAADYKKPCSSS